MKIPCLKEDGLKIFTTTAAQRRHLGEDTFLKTHYPIQMRKYNESQESSDVSENDLLSLLQSLEGVSPGNRIVLLYGAAGSGKSEVMAWLNLHLNQKSQRPILRISRTDLNIFRIIERFKYWLTGEFFEELTHQRWEEIRRKPRTFTKLLTLRSLEHMLDTDNIINALYYRLVDKIEPLVTQLLEMNEDVTTLELIPRNLFNEIQEQTILPIEIDYEIFRHHLQEEFRNQLLEGISIKATLQKISQNIAIQDQRPILLIDDLVQSMNIFATEFLDYFITLDEGDWDVVIGLTPASFEMDERHRAILERITYLDTIDDRVQKLWLSDERGNTSYFLSEDNCVDFAFEYLQMFRQINEVECKQCPAFSKCSTFNGVGKKIVAPFNHAALVRIFRALPDHKGKIRYFLKYIREALQSLVNEQGINIAFRNLRSNITIEATNPQIQAIASWYTPIDISTGEYELLPSLMDFFDLNCADGKIHIQSLSVKSSIPIRTNQSPISDLTHEAIEAWLLGEQVNKQLLDNLRKGAAQWLKTVYPVEVFHRSGVANPSGILRYKQTQMSTSPPIQIESVDEFDGIPLGRNIGHAAFYLSLYSRVSRSDRLEIEDILGNDSRMLSLIWHGIDFHHHYQSKLVKLLGNPLEVFAFASLVITMIANGSNIEFLSNFPTQLSNKIRNTREMIILRTQKKLLLDTQHDQLTRQMFDDFFCLRKNIFDAVAIQKISDEYTFDMLLESIRVVTANSLPDEYRARDMRLSEYVAHMQKTISVFDEILQQSTWKIPKRVPTKARKLIITLQEGIQVPVDNLDSDMLETLKMNAPKVYKQISLILRLDTISDYDLEP